MISTLFFELKNVTLHMLRVTKILTMDNQFVFFGVIFCIGGFMTSVSRVLQEYILFGQAAAILLSIAASTVAIIRFIKQKRNKDGT